MEWCTCVKWSTRRTITSESVVERKRTPSACSSSLSDAVFTRLPLWPSAMVLGPIELIIGWAFSHRLPEPVVE